MWPRSDFDYSVVGDVAHRPWPMPERSWLMTQTWHDLLFAHWRIDPAVLRPRVPQAFELDLFEGTAWIAVVPFRMANVGVRGLPGVPSATAFPELNVRTYVHAGGRPGVFFFSLDAASRIAVHVARVAVHLPYFHAGMELTSRDEWIGYVSRRRAGPGEAAATFVGRYRPSGPPAFPIPGSLEYFLTERYCLYTTDAGGRPYRLEIHHPPWPVQPAVLETSANTMLDAAGFRLAATPELVHFAARQDVVAWWLERI
jgi:uncharacterized protein YqjF (DUF2071 family)